ncbi:MULTISPECIES: CtsR family transcriptional regulator [Enterococcus]|uniref:Transcriptional regulator CtsR n=1 Tax=Enterococcus diestrammenae TaxID=1155073 RepID=A0ABV0F0H8_9ENTE|nr:CtsR family transcriptional regulator [Enterococcus diestrammenae]KAF1299683.1 CtsR family transcriptional regulator [Enterococcus diestrammenae]HIX70095.1 CtsR family transcriptional regulator [Candidatus Enterococcus stercoravium]
MTRHNTSDLIEAYLKKILEDSEIIEIRRTEMAQQFNCVPSQINYVINTRFTIQRGYTVASKRGGGGYIRIEKVKISDKHRFLEQVAELVDEALTEKNALAIIQKLYEEELLTQKEGNLILAVMAQSTLADYQEADKIRASLMRAVLERLSYEK